MNKLFFISKVSLSSFSGVCLKFSRVFTQHLLLLVSCKLGCNSIFDSSALLCPHMIWGCSEMPLLRAKSAFNLNLFNLLNVDRTHPRRSADIITAEDIFSWFYYQTLYNRLDKTKSMLK